jgi:hypothetical protein
MPRNVILLFIILCGLYAQPALAEAMSYGERTQETIAAGNNRFLIFVGAPDGEQSGYTVDMIKIQDGMPFYIPLFMEEYDTDTHRINLGYGVAFQAAAYTYSKASGMLDFKTIEPEKGVRYDFRYKLIDDIFKLQQVTVQHAAPCKGDACKTMLPKVLFKLADNAKQR